MRLTFMATPLLAWVADCLLSRSNTQEDKWLGPLRSLNVIFALPILVFCLFWGPQFLPTFATYNTLDLCWNGCGIREGQI